MDVGAVLQSMAQSAGDVFETTGAKTGALAYCKKGDHLLTLGVDSAAPGAKIAVEAKEDRGFNLATALDDIEQARQNREAQVGIFVFSKKTAPAGLTPFARHGKHIVLVWDREDQTSDVFLQAGVSVAKALVVRERLSQEKSKDSLALKAAIAAISKEIASLAQISKWAQTIKANGDKIGKKADGMAKRIRKKVELLEKYLVPAGEIAVDASAIRPATP